ncbi:MAG: hypothetical protein RR338_01150 [Clostridia bacterium]
MKTKEFTTIYVDTDTQTALDICKMIGVTVFVERTNGNRYHKYVAHNGIVDNFIWLMRRLKVDGSCYYFGESEL